MRVVVALLSLAIVPSACTPAARDEAETATRNDAGPFDPAAASDSAYVIRGVGQPGQGTDWSAVILDGRIFLDSPTSAGWTSIAAPQPRLEADRRVYETRYLTLTVEPGACDLATHRARQPDRVTIAWDAGRFVGCGGPRPVLREIGDTWWELLRIGHDAAPSGRAPAAILHLGRNGSLGGTLSCNDGGVRTMWTGGGGFLPVGTGFESTAVGCSDPAGEAFGRRFWGGMETARSWRREGDRLFVTFTDGTEAELRYLI